MSAAPMKSRIPLDVPSLETSTPCSCETLPPVERAKRHDQAHIIFPIQRRYVQILEWFYASNVPCSPMDGSHLQLAV